MVCQTVSGTIALMDSARKVKSREWLIWDGIALEQAEIVTIEGLIDDRCRFPGGKADSAGKLQQVLTLTAAGATLTAAGAPSCKWCARFSCNCGKLGRSDQEFATARRSERRRRTRFAVICCARLDSF